MKNFLLSLLTNRFGIVLATVNVVGFLITMPLFGSHRPAPVFMLLLAVNMPAVVLSRLLFEAVPLFRVESIVFFIVLQWLFVAWSARKLAMKFCQKPA